MGLAFTFGCGLQNYQCCSLLQLCTTNADWVGAYIGVWITKLLIVLALMVMYHQRTTDGVGAYVGVWIKNYQSYWFSIVL